MHVAPSTPLPKSVSPTGRDGSDGLKDTKATVAAINFVSFVALSTPARRRIIAHRSADEVHIGATRNRD